MSEPFIAEIKMFGGNFAPQGYAQCDGQLLPIAQNAALFSILGTTYGGDGRTTLGLPDLRGRFPMHRGSGSGLTPRVLGQKSGTESHTLTTNQMPGHTHSVAIPASSGEGQKVEPDASYLGGGEEPTKPYSPTSDTSLASFNTGSQGNGLSVNHMPPFQCVNFIIALVGLFPSRS